MGSSDARADRWPERLQTPGRRIVSDGRGSSACLSWPARVSEGRSRKEMQAVR